MEKVTFKQREIVIDSILIILGILVLSEFILGNYHQFLLSVLIALNGLLFVITGVIGFIVDIKISQKLRAKAVLWKYNLPLFLAFVLFAAAFNTPDQFPSETYRLGAITAGTLLWVLAINYDIWRKYRRYLKHIPNE